MNIFKLNISTPDGNMFEGAAVKLDVRGKQGELAVMAGHTPFITAVVPCRCRILLPDGSERFARVEHGLLAVSEGGATLLSGGFRWE